MKMGKSEINPFGVVTESSGTTSSSDSEPDYATEMSPPPACDGKSCTSGEDEPMAYGEQAERRGRGRGGRYGPWRGRMHPMMFMMMMGGPRRGGHGHPPPMGPALSPPSMAMGRSATPDCRGCPGRRRQMKDERPRCHSAPGGRRGGPWAQARPCGGPRPGGPCMRRRFMRQMLRNPEFWQRMHEKFAETEDNGPLAKDVSDNETKKEKKCRGKRGERREMWQRFMQHMFEEMNLHASTESSERDEGNHIDKCSEEENATNNKTAADKKKVHFGGDEYFDEENLRPGGFPWMFPGRLGMRFSHGGPWARPGYFGEMNMHDDPRMMYGEPRMGHGDPRMMFGCRPRRRMFRHMMQNAASSEDEKCASDCEEKINKRCQMREKRQKFRRAVQEMGVHPWIFRMLAYQMYGKKTGSEDKEAEVEEIPGKKTEKKERFLQILKDLGTYPWMFRVLANQRARAAATTGSESEREAPLEGATATDEGSTDRCRRRQRRRMFREMAKQMGWTSDSDGEALTDGEKESKPLEKQEEKKRRKEERRRMRGMMRGMGWMPWMMMGRHHHHHHGHHPAEVEDSDAEHNATNSNKKPKIMQKEKREKVKQFRQAVQEMGVRPWMFRLLAHEIYGKKNEAATSEDESANGERNGEKGQKKEKYLQIVREIGAYPWMFRVLANQRARAAATTGSESEGEATLGGAAAADEESPDRRRRRQRRQMFREMAKQMGWTSDSDGEALTDGEKAEKERRKEERRMRKMMKGMGWMPWMMMGRHHHHDGHHQSEAEKSDAEQGATKCEVRREKVKQFRQAVQEMGVRPWMFRLLAREMYGKTDDTSEDENPKEEKKGKKNEKKEKYVQILREVGTYPWMFRVLANQRARTAAPTGSESEGEAPLGGAAAADEGSPDRCRRRQRRRMFTEMAKQMGWKSDSDGEALTDSEKEGKPEGKQEEKERRKEERRRMREMMRGMGWMPWMMMGRHHHHRDHDEDHHLTQ